LTSVNLVRLYEPSVATPANDRVNSAGSNPCGRCGDTLFDVLGQVVDPASLVRGQSVSEAGHRDDLVADTVDRVESLQCTAASNARSCVQGLQPALADQGVRGSGLVEGDSGQR